MAPRLAVTAFVLLVLALAPHGQHPAVLGDESRGQWNSSNPTGVDIRVNEVSMAYTNSGDQSNYRMFSSNYPISGFNRPANLYVIDGMVNVETTLTVSIENTGTANSGVVDVTVTLLHNEYDFFEFVNTTVQMNGLSGSSSDTVQIPIRPGYAGNHTMVIQATPTITDDDTSDNALNRHFTVGATYFNCDTTSNWSLGSGWVLSTDTAISKGSSCHVGNGQTSTYTNNMLASMTTPLMDMSDAIKPALRTNGLSFYYTGSSAVNDVLRVYGSDTMGAWVQIATLSGTVDQDFFDGINWQTFSLNDKGATSPLIPVPDALFHARSQFKFEFSSDATETDLGFYIDEIVMMYDQKVRIGEFDVDAQGVATTGSVPGEWGSVTVQILNTGNITETFVPTVTGIPDTWSSYFARPSGTSFNPEFGLTVRPGEPYEFNLMLMPDVNASTGYQQMSIAVVSQQYPEVNTTLPVQFLVKADRIPHIVPLTSRPSCPPTYTCSFEVEVDNLGDATDVFDLALDTSTLPSGWSVQYDWTQRESVLIRPQQPQSVSFMMNVPEEAAPDTVVHFGLTVTAQNDSTRTVTSEIEISASMISNVSILLEDIDVGDLVSVRPGEAMDLTYTIVNHATRQDIFLMRVDVTNQGQWSVEQPTRPPAVLNAGASASFTVSVTPPETAQAGDRGPIIVPVLESERSGMELRGNALEGLRAAALNNVALQGMDLPSRVNAGQINILNFNITNLGNGPITAMLTPETLPVGWTYEVVQAENVNGYNVSLTPSYALQDQTNVTVRMFVPGDEDAGSRNTVRWAVILQGGIEDTHPEDNSLDWTVLTAAVRSVTVEAGNASATGTVGEAMFAEAIISNSGNAPESRLSVRASVSTSPPTSDVVAFFTVDGGDRDVGNEVPFTVGRNTSMTLRMDLLLPDDIDLNTRIVVRFEILGGVDSEGLPVTMDAEHLIVVEQRRSFDVSIQAVLPSVEPRPSPALVWVNTTSTSTSEETVLLTAAYPEDWQVVCNQRLLNSSGERASLGAGHLTAQAVHTVCEVANIGDVFNGQVTFVLRTDGGSSIASETLTFAFKAPQPEDEFNSTAAAIGGGGVVMALFVGLLLMRKKKSGDAAYEALEKTAPPILTGQPAGPPISTQLATPETEDQLALNDALPQAMVNSTVQVTGVDGPPLPAEGLPNGWTMDQWAYYGQQYLDGTL